MTNFAIFGMRRRRASLRVEMAIEPRAVRRAYRAWVKTPSLITDSAALAEFCSSLRGAPYIAVDTEFLRERTYYARLCLIQIAHGEHAAAIDPLAKEIDLAPLGVLMRDPSILKVFHSASQDLEIFLHAMGTLPAPIFDTQVAAAVCGLGDFVGYASLVSSLLDIEVDKASQATDWSLRPLSARQLEYALGDVVHLCDVYEKLAAQLTEKGRGEWVQEEMAALVDERRYRIEPSEAWRRLKIRGPSRRSLALLRDLAAWREETAIRRDLPRPWVLHDEALVEIAQNVPRDLEALARVRMIKAPTARGADGQAILDIVRRTLAEPPESWPELPPRKGAIDAIEPLVVLLQALLRLRCDAEGVAPRIVASHGDLEAIALGKTPEGPALTGWRRELFGDHALALCAGRVALTGGPGGTVSMTDVARESPGDSLPSPR